MKKSNLPVTIVAVALAIFLSTQAIADGIDSDVGRDLPISAGHQLAMKVQSGTGRVLLQKSLKIGNDTDPCTADNAGTLRWTGAAFQGCDGSTWKSFGQTVAVDYANCGYAFGGNAASYWSAAGFTGSTGGAAQLYCPINYVLVGLNYGEVDSAYCCALKMQ